MERANRIVLERLRQTEQMSSSKSGSVNDDIAGMGRIERAAAGLHENKGGLLKLLEGAGKKKLR
jgi:hypothetical protein